MITLEQVEGLIVSPSYPMLSFEIPDSVDGTKRRATFIALNSKMSTPTGSADTQFVRG